MIAAISARVLIAALGLLALATSSLCVLKWPWGALRRRLRYLTVEPAYANVHACRIRPADVHAAGAPTQ